MSDLPSRFNRVYELDDEDSGLRVWHAAVESLLASGRTPTEALEGANLILEAWRRKRAEARARGGTPEGGGGGDDTGSKGGPPAG